MPASRHLRPLAAGTIAAAVAASGASALAAAGADQQARAAAATLKVTAHRVGGVHLGDLASDLRARGLIGRVGHGCGLGGPGTRAAALEPPLKGSVDFTPSNPRKAANITVTGGAAAKGVGVGARSRAIRRAFPHVTFDHGTDSVFGVTLAKVPRRDGGRFQFAVDTKTKRVTLIGVPFIAFCD